MTGVGYQTVESAQAPADRRHLTVVTVTGIGYQTVESADHRHQTVVTVTGIGYQTVQSAQAPADRRHQTELWADGEAVRHQTDDSAAGEPPSPNGVADEF